MDLERKPLTWEQIERLDSRGNRMWTQRELDIMGRNASFYDSVQKLSKFRCKLPDCGYVITDPQTAYEISGVGIICAACWHMAQAIKNITTRGPYGY